MNPQTSDTARTDRHIVGLVIVILGWAIAAPSGFLLLAGLVGLLFDLSLPSWSLIGLALSTVFGLGLVYVGRKLKAPQQGGTLSEE